MPSCAIILGRNSGRHSMKIVVGSDHAGFPMKAGLLDFLRQRGHAVTDVGSYDPQPVDFPDIARKVAVAITSGEAERGLMVCGTGVGAAIGANKMKGIRAAVCHDVHSAHQCVEHDDVNVMCIGAQIVGPWLAKDLVAAYLDARFSTDEEFRRRVAKLAEMDEGR
jgi:ribose 5-phosphate isomerase B